MEVHHIVIQGLIAVLLKRNQKIILVKKKNQKKSMNHQAQIIQKVEVDLKVFHLQEVIQNILIKRNQVNIPIIIHIMILIILINIIKKIIMIRIMKNTIIIDIIQKIVILKILHIKIIINHINMEIHLKIILLEIFLVIIHIQQEEEEEIIGFMTTIEIKLHIKSFIKIFKFYLVSVN